MRRSGGSPWTRAGSLVVQRRPMRWLLLACALVVLGNAGCQVTAFRGYGTDTLHIHSVASGATTNTNQGIWPDTSPSIAMKPDNTYLVAFRALGSLDLFIYSTATGQSTDTGQGVHPGTSPSIAVKHDGSFAVAFRGYGTDTIFIYNSTTGVSTDTHQGIYPGTSPSITAMSNGSYSVAFRALGSLDLFVYNTATGFSTDTGQGVHPDTSPSISAIRGGGYNAAFRGYGTDTVHVYNPAAGVSINTHQGIWPGTSPSIISLRDGGYEIAFRALGSLDQFIYSSATALSTDTGQGVHPGTSPSITGLRYWTSEKYGGPNGTVDTVAELNDVWNIVEDEPDFDSRAAFTANLAPADLTRLANHYPTSARYGGSLDTAGERAAVEAELRGEGIDNKVWDGLTPADQEVMKPLISDGTAPPITTADYDGGPGDAEKKYCRNPLKYFRCRTARNLADEALNSATNRFSEESLHNGRGDAYRHCIWSGHMTVLWDRGQAKKFGDLHEDKPNNPRSEKAMDQHNNKYGRDVGDLYDNWSDPTEYEERKESVRDHCQTVANQDNDDRLWTIGEVP
jgi:hypothetical protein